MMCAPQSQSPVLRPFEEFNILLEPRGPDSGSILKNRSGDCFVNLCHLLLRFVHEASFSHPCCLVIPVFLLGLPCYISIQSGFWASGLSSLVGLGPFVVLPIPIRCRLVCTHSLIPCSPV